MKNNTRTRLTTGITALALTCSLGLSGCNTSNNEFRFISGEDGTFVATDNSYIDINSINNIYVITTKNNISKEKEIYIAKKITVEHNYTTTQDHIIYQNIFNNIKIHSTQNEESKHNIEILEETPLLDYLLAYDLVKARYNYEDMVEIYNLIKENYSLSNSNSISKKLIKNIM